MKSWKFVALALAAAAVMAMLLILVIAAVMALAGVEIGTPAPAQPQARQAPRQPVPIITVKPSEDPRSRVAHFIACARGSQPACALAGSWLIAQAEIGRRLSVCLHAKGPPEDIEQCAVVEATWPE